MEFIDTHCHIHAADYNLDSRVVINNAHASGVNKMICIGTDEIDSSLAVKFAGNNDNVWASVGLHPHDAKLGQDAFDKLAKLVSEPKVVAIGECGLDYYYNHSSKEDQVRALHYQIDLALKNDLPMIFHIRDAFVDFWPIFDQYKHVRGVVHSFTATNTELDQTLARGLYVGLNGIMTFTKDEKQLEAAKSVPLDKLIIETDAPFLTPKPIRGTINEPKNVVLTAEFIAGLRNESLQQISQATTSNAIKLFNL